MIDQMPKLILIKHARPEVIESIPSEQWKLSERGKQSCIPLADKIAPHSPQIIVSSTEPKAIETAELVGARLNIPHETAQDLHEHDRSNVPHMRSGEFISMMELLFRRPDEVVLGQEAADDAESRFAKALKDVLEKHANQSCIAVVSHGTVLALFLAQYAKRPAFELWRQLGLPSFAVSELPEYRVMEIVPQIG